MEALLLRVFLVIFVLLFFFLLVLFFWRSKNEEQLYTLHKKAEERRRETESRLNQILDNIHQVCWISSVDGKKIIYVSPIYEQIMGLSCESLYINPASWLEVVNPVDRTRVAQAVEQAVNYKYDIEYSIVRPDGSIRWIADRSFPITNQKGEIYRVAGITEDITERKLMEENIKQLNKDLESFSYSISHDLKAPIRAIGGFTRFLQEESSQSLNEESKRVLNTMMESTQRMEQLIQDLLEFSRLGRQELRKSEIDMQQLAQMVYQELKNSVPERRIEFRLNRLPKAFGDPSLMRQVFTNFLSNAIKYSKQREVALVEVGSQSEDNQNIYYVKDNGAGFDMQYAHKLFNVFQRLHAADQFEGTGIGLANVYRIIQRHGGKVWAESKVNEGATFYFSLPKPLHIQT